MQGAPERKDGEDGLPVPPYAVYNIGNQNPENLLDFVDILQQELIAAGVLRTITTSRRTSSSSRCSPAMFP